MKENKHNSFKPNKSLGTVAAAAAGVKPAGHCGGEQGPAREPQHYVSHPEWVEVSWTFDYAFGLEADATRPALPQWGFPRVMGSCNLLTLALLPAGSTQHPAAKPWGCQSSSRGCCCSFGPLSTEMAAPLARLSPALQRAMVPCALMHCLPGADHGRGAGASFFPGLAAKGPSSPGK